MAGCGPVCACGPARPGRLATVGAWAFARCLAMSEGPAHRRLGPRKQALLGDLRGDVLEIGPGTGLNVRYLQPGVRWVGVEPNRFCHPYIAHRATEAGVHATVTNGSVADLGVATASVDAVVGTFVLCTVADLGGAIAEVRRVLRPGGRFVFIEHVGAPAGTRLRAFQDLVAPLWLRLTGSCRLNRDTGEAIARAGFAAVQAEHFRSGGGPNPLAPSLAGMATAA